MSELRDAIASAREAMGWVKGHETNNNAWLYGILVGWEDAIGGDKALLELAAKHGWSAEDVERLRRYHRAVEGFLRAPEGS